MSILRLLIDPLPVTVPLIVAVALGAWAWSVHAETRTYGRHRAWVLTDREVWHNLLADTRRRRDTCGAPQAFERTAT